MYTEMVTRRRCSIFSLLALTSDLGLVQRGEDLWL